MSIFPKFDAAAALNEIQTRDPAKAAKPAKVRSGSPNFSSISDFSSPSPPILDIPEDRRAWTSDLCRAVFRWLSVHPPDVWTAARIGERIAPLWRHLETCLDDYERTGEPGDRKAAVYAANAIAATAARAEREWRERKDR